MTTLADDQDLEQPDDDEADPLRAADGIVQGVMLSLMLWCLILIAWLTLLS